jgi:hypothetical protein
MQITSKSQGGRKMKRFILILAVVLLLVTMLAPAALAATNTTTATTVSAKEPGPNVLPPNSNPYGKSYGEWSAAWWQWALETPASVNPVLDPTGANCAVGQKGTVWFLAGTFGNGRVERSCTVPTETPLYFPLINNFYGAFLTDPPDQRTEAYLRAQVKCDKVDLRAEIDGIKVKNPLQYSEQSPLFDVQLPADNVFGLGADVIPELRLSPSVDAGYYLFLPPLPSGEHEIQWKASQSCPSGKFSQEVTYHVTVRDSHKK